MAKKRAWNRLDKIEGWDWIEARIWRPLTDLPFDWDLEFLSLERVVRDCDESLRRLRVELSGKRRHAIAVVGRSVDEQRGGARDGRQRDKAQDGQGGKSEDWMLNGFELRRRAWSGRDGLDLSEPVAAQRRFLGASRPAKPAPKCPIVSGTITILRAS